MLTKQQLEIENEAMREVILELKHLVELPWTIEYIKRDVLSQLNTIIDKYNLD